MLRFLSAVLGWIPVIGLIFKGLYIGSLVGKIVAVAKGWTPGESVQGKTGEELDEALGHEANMLVGEAMEPLELGSIGSIVQKRAVVKVVSVMRERATAAA
tara:strand:- start:34 stop:336 length:303 start_codon:yes stop_codon:yes gene_type:complete